MPSRIHAALAGSGTAANGYRAPDSAVITPSRSKVPLLSYT